MWIIPQKEGIIPGKIQKNKKARNFIFIHAESLSFIPTNNLITKRVKEGGFMTDFSNFKGSVEKHYP